MKHIFGIFSLGCVMWVGGAILGIAFWSGLIWAIIHILKINGIL